MCGCTHFLGGAFHVRHVSINALRWLALSMIVSAAFNRLLCNSMKLGSVLSHSTVVLVLGTSFEVLLMVWFRILDKPLIGSVSIPSSRRFVSDVVGCEYGGCCDIVWVCGVDKIHVIGLGEVCF